MESKAEYKYYKKEDFECMGDFDTDDNFDLFIEKTKNSITREPENKKDLILKYLKYLGLNKIDLTSGSTIRAYVKDIIEKEDIEYCGLFQPKLNSRDSLDDSTNGIGNGNILIDQYLRLYVKENNKFKIVNFTLVQNLITDGYWNKIQLYRDNSNKHYIFRSAINKKERHSEPDDEYLYKSFDENLKHMILYFLLKYYYPVIKYKIVPEIYYFGLYKDPETNKKTFITI